MKGKKYLWRRNQVVISLSHGISLYKDLILISQPNKQQKKKATAGA
jgi:hypothetical protein